MRRPDFPEIERTLAQKGASVARLCRSAGVAESTWNRLRSGRHRPHQATLAQLARAYADLTGGDWPTEPATIVGDAEPDPDAIEAANENARRQGDAATLAPVRHARLPEAA